MAPRKRTVTQEPLLSTLARKLGHAAGTLTKVTQEFADNVSAGEFAGSARGRRHARKKLSRAVRPRRTGTGAAGADTKQRSPRRKALRRKARRSNLKK